MTNIKLVKKNDKEWVVTDNGVNVGIVSKPKRSIYTYHAIVTGGKLVKGDTQKELKENIAEYLESLAN